jgi:hypothetical protein
LIARDKNRATAVKKTNIVFLCPVRYINLRKICRDEGIVRLFITEVCKKTLAT